MPFVERLIQRGAQVVLERPVQTMSLEAQRNALQASGERVAQRLSTLRGSPANYRLLRHIIGIERWGQRRLRTALGEPLLHDEYHPYKPEPGKTWEELQAEFQAARQATLALIEAFQQAGPPSMARPIPHNQYGELSPKAWLRYLDLHANSEMLKMK